MYLISSHPTPAPSLLPIPCRLPPLPLGVQPCDSLGDRRTGVRPRDTEHARVTELSHHPSPHTHTEVDRHVSFHHTTARAPPCGHCVPSWGERRAGSRARSTVTQLAIIQGFSALGVHAPSRVPLAARGQCADSKIDENGAAALAIIAHIPPTHIAPTYRAHTITHPITACIPPTFTLGSFFCPSEEVRVCLSEITTQLPPVLKKKRM